MQNINRMDNDKFKNHAMKSHLIKYLFNNINLSQFGYTILKQEKQLDLFNATKFYVTPNFNGSNCLLIFMKYLSEYHSFLIDRSTLAFKFQSINIDNVKIRKVQFDADCDIYQGSIFDGILINKKDDDIPIFVINEVYFFKGHNMTNIPLPVKLDVLNSYFSNDMSLQNTTKIRVIVGTIYNLFETRDLIDVHANMFEDIGQIKGLQFFPELSGTKLIYLFSTVINFKNNRQEKNHDSLVSYKFIDGWKANFKIQKTQICDVYDLFLMKKSSQVHMGIALIPSIKLSLRLQEYFKEKTSAVVKCRFELKRNKWIPIEILDESAKVDLIDHVVSKD